MFKLISQKDIHIIQHRVNSILFIHVTSNKLFCEHFVCLTCQQCVCAFCGECSNSTNSFWRVGTEHNALNKSIPFVFGMLNFHSVFRWWISSTKNEFHVELIQILIRLILTLKNAIYWGWFYETIHVIPFQFWWSIRTHIDMSAFIPFFHAKQNNYVTSLEFVKGSIWSKNLDGCKFDTLAWAT